MGVRDVAVLQREARHRGHRVEVPDELRRVLREEVRQRHVYVMVRAFRVLRIVGGIAQGLDVVGVGGGEDVLWDHDACTPLRRRRPGW